MRQAIRDKLTYANVMATLAVFIALGGSSYAALRVGSKEIRDNSVRSKDIRNRSLTGTDVAANRLGGGAIKESTLGQVPRATDADRVGGRTADELRDKCPLGTAFRGGSCIEESASAPASFLTAQNQCTIRDRVLPSYLQLFSQVGGFGGGPAPGGEFTSNVYENAGALRVVVLTNGSGSVSFQDVLTPATRAYRCVEPPREH